MKCEDASVGHVSWELRLDDFDISLHSFHSQEFTDEARTTFRNAEAV
jgi:hypothetical protein